MARLAVDGEQIVAVVEGDRPGADHRAFLEGEHVRVGPGVGPVARNLVLDPRVGPGRPVGHDIKQPDETVRRLPDDAVAVGAERRVGNHNGPRPVIGAFHEPRTADPRILAVFARAAVIDEVQVAIGQFGEADRMLIRIGQLRPKDPFVTNVLARPRRFFARDRQPKPDRQ